MKTGLTGVLAVTTLALLLAVASRPDAAPPSSEAELARAEALRARELERICERLGRIDGRLEGDVDRGEATEDIRKRLVELTAAVREMEVSTRRVARSLDDRKGPDALERAILAPSVQISVRGSVGGGTIIHSGPEASVPPGTYVLTAFHVIQKSVERDAEGRETREPIRVRVFSTGGAPETVDGDLILYDERKDLALVKLRTMRSFPGAARLAGRERIRSAGVFTPVYAVGCPLGHDPLPSAGQITTLRKEVNGERFWMMSAPTIFGNSGGGVFHAESLEMIGVSAMICTFENPMATPVPHLGIMVPLDAVYDWLDANGYGFLHAPAVASQGNPRSNPGFEPACR